jgi:voltage-gated potassium channel
MEFTFTFLKTFLYGLYFVAPLLLLIVLTTIFLGQIVGHIESWKRFDIRPTYRTSKVLSVLIALTGLIFTGIIVAIAVRSATYAFNIHVDFFK